MNAELLRKALLILLLMVPPAMAQGFAGLGGDAAGFAMPQRGSEPVFPRDHGAHSDFRIEWWYLTANLTGEDGQEYGAQWTLFRSALAPGERAGWQSPQLWMAHAALTSADGHLTAERLARGGIGQAGVALSPFNATIDDWHMTGLAPRDRDAVAALDVVASGANFSYRLNLDAAGPIVLHGESGFSVKSERGHASHYYSQPSYRVAGSITIAGRQIAVTGQAWLDHEWSSQPLDPDQSGWDWFAFHLATGEKVMVMRLRESEGTGYDGGTWVAADGRAEAFSPGDVMVTPLAWGLAGGHRVPLRWRVQIPAKGLDVTTRPLNPQSWMDMQVPYWEGPVGLDGSHAGRGYIEMTGYQAPKTP